MGPTGSGKTTFINLASGGDMRVGAGLKSCTDAVQIAKPFVLDGRTVTLIDTPGFDDTTKSDAQILEMLADYLSQEYEAGKRLNAVIYVHRITDVRMSGISTRTFRMFRQLCGNGTMSNAAIVTNHWESVDEAVGRAREQELASQSIFFKLAFDGGARSYRHYNTVESAHNIIRQLLGNLPKPLLIQEQIVDQHMSLADTDAGTELSREMLQQIENHKEEGRILKEQMEEAIRNKDEQMKRWIEEQSKMMERETARLRDEIARLRSCRGRRGLRRVFCEVGRIVGDL
ncbi:hypothetical protein BOTBODRAFT_166765 [Botryobasidium botryosum FD-172 SS1]|uniref:G domain-containing protein n=1 Tax=Botryobasidium botryosum (strain FD-172 SS1) TaxID=930990 RepID=A0A067LWG1_BOTB1|nr:hypothetical protein BOTBODRAFT_166765 [Botryobasidium botryosum FD-172 SS1]